MFFDRGSQHDYDAWTEAGGPEFAQSSIKWDWEGIFPYFKKVADDHEPNGSQSVILTTFGRA